jgi:hypothetical protein
MLTLSERHGMCSVVRMAATERGTTVRLTTVVSCSRYCSALLPPLTPAAPVTSRRAVLVVVVFVVILAAVAPGAPFAT